MDTEPINNKYIYICLYTNIAVNKPYNGQWSYWDAWSDCSVSCGGGVRTRKRSCTEPPPENGGDDCVGVSIQSDTCNSFMCPGKNIIFKFIKYYFILFIYINTSMFFF